MLSDESQDSIPKKSRVREPARRGLLNAIGQELRQTLSDIKHAFKITNYDTKSDYREFFIEEDISQTSIVTFLLAVSVALFTIGDYLFFAFSPVFFILAALRFGLIVYSFFQIRFIRRSSDYRKYDLSTLLYLLTLVFAILFVNATRPENFVPHIIIIDMAVLVFYLVIPNRFIFQAAPSLIFSLGEVGIVFLTFGGFDMPAVVTALLSLVFANVVAALSSLRLHLYRWQIFQNVEQRKDTDRLAAIGQTAGMIGHDIRNPLQAIVSELYLAKEAMEQSPHVKDKQEALESINLIEEQTEYISKIVSDLQDYARPLKPEYQEVDLSQMVVSIFQMVRVPDKITLKVDIIGFPRISTDPTLIRRTLTNLVNNAIQAMPDGGFLELRAFIKGNKAIITIADTGKGIPEEIRPRLFTPLVTTKAKGQGLGLAVVKRIVEALGGTITFESQIDKGTKFIISLPLWSEE